MADISKIQIQNATYDIKDETARQSISDLDTSVDTRINNLQASLLTEMVVIGDSYSSRTYLDSNYKLWCELVAEVLNLNLHNYGDPGAGFVAGGDERQSTFYSQINEAYNDTSFNNDYVKYVFIYGGTNDLRYSNTNVKNDYISAFNNTLENARLKFPKAKIIFLGSDTFQNFYTKAMDDTENITELWIDQNVKNCTKYFEREISCIDLTLFFIGMATYFENGLFSHPNYKGHRELANAVLNGLTSSSNAFLHLITATPSLTSSNYELIAPLFGVSQYQLRCTDKGFELYLQSCLHKTGSNEIVKINFPFNIRLPYSAVNNNKLVAPNGFFNCNAFNSTHNTAGLIGTHTNLYDYPYGREYFEVYELYGGLTYQYRDLIYKTFINI